MNLFASLAWSLNNLRANLAASKLSYSRTENPAAKSALAEGSSNKVSRTSLGVSSPATANSS